MHYGKHHRTNHFITILIASIGLFLLNSCSPHKRLVRLLKKHPHLIENRVKDSIVIRQGKVIDTTLLIKETHDTIQYGGTTIIRTSDTFRFITRIEPCTTFIQKRETIFPKETKKDAEKGQGWQVYERISLIILCVLLTLSLLFKRK